MVDGPGEFDPQRTRHEADVYFSRCAIARPDPLSSPHLLNSYPPADVSIDRIGDMLRYDLPQIVGAGDASVREP